MRYDFYDVDKYENEQNLPLDDYLELINICTKYSKTFSFIIYNSCKSNVVIPKIICDNTFQRENTLYNQAQIHYVKLTPEVNQCLLNLTDNIWSWSNFEEEPLPEDPTFYRKDGSVFFSSIIHEGECSLHPKGNEDISSIIKKGNWREMKDDEARFFFPDINDLIGKRETITQIKKAGDGSMS